MKPLCFVLMPFGKKKYDNDIVIDFDDVYENLIRPAIDSAELEPIRADEERVDGIIHKPMFERLVLCEYAVADLTTANANVFYELGVRHAVKEFTTVMIFAGSTRLPFDVALLRSFPYELDKDGKLADAMGDRKKLTEKLMKAKEDRSKDSPLYQLLEDYPKIAHEKTDVFRKAVSYSRELKNKLFAIRAKSNKEDKFKLLNEMEKECGKLSDQEAGVVIDLFLSYRSLGSQQGYQRMIDLTARMSPVLSQTVLVQEQLGFALNRIGKRAEAEQTLLQLIQNRGGSSETYGILGRVYKDRWEDADKAGKKFEANAQLRKAIDIYLKGFNTDWRDAYPGVNAITLMAISEPEDRKWEEIFPVVKYAVEQKIKSGKTDYWDHATMLELSVISRTWDKAEGYLGDTLANVREKFEPETTARNIMLIARSRSNRRENIDRENEIANALTEKATAM